MKKKTASRTSHPPALKPWAENKCLAEIIPGKFFYVTQSAVPYSERYNKAYSQHLRLGVPDSPDLTYLEASRDVAYLAPHLDHFHVEWMRMDEIVRKQAAESRPIVYVDKFNKPIVTFAVAAYAMVRMKLTPDEAYAKVSHLPNEPIPRFADSLEKDEVPMTILDYLRGLKKAMDLEFYDYDSFDHVRFKALRKAADISWIIPGKLIAMPEPQIFPWRTATESTTTTGTEPLLFQTMDQWASFFKDNNVGLVLRLNYPIEENMLREAIPFNEFTDRGVDHAFHPFEDGSLPSEELLTTILEKLDETLEVKNKAAAVHCIMGVGRTGTIIGAYAIKKWGFSGKEIIAWMRICRTTLVHVPQQPYLIKLEEKWKDVGTEKKDEDDTTTKRVKSSSSDE